MPTSDSGGLFSKCIRSVAILAFFTIPFFTLQQLHLNRQYLTKFSTVFLEGTYHINLLVCDLT